MAKEKKAMFNKIAPKVKDAMNSKPGQIAQKALGVGSTILSIGGGILTLAGAIVSINAWSQAKIDKQKEVETNYPD